MADPASTWGPEQATGAPDTFQAAIERLGAHRDGVLRRHMRMPDGHLRDTVVYSILDSEWPMVRRNLDHRLDHGASA